MAAFTLLSGCAPEHTWSGAISDSTCGLYHEFDEHGGVTTEHECALMCVRQGAKFVFVSNEEHRIYAIEDQDAPALATHAGYPVRVTGRLRDQTLAVSRVERVP